MTREEQETATSAAALDQESLPPTVAAAAAATPEEPVSLSRSCSFCSDPAPTQRSSSAAIDSLLRDRDEGGPEAAAAPGHREVPGSSWWSSMLGDEAAEEEAVDEAKMAREQQEALKAEEPNFNPDYDMDALLDIKAQRERHLCAD